MNIDLRIITITRILLSVLEFMNSFCLHSNTGKLCYYYLHLIEEESDALEVKELAIIM